MVTNEDKNLSRSLPGAAERGPLRKMKPMEKKPMKRSFSKVLVTSFAVATAASAYALPKSPCEPRNDVCCDDVKPGPFAFSFPGDMGLACPKDFYVHVDGLAFQAKQDGMEFATTDSNGLGAPLTSGEVTGFDDNNSDWDFNPGIRFGIGAYVNHDAWNIDFNWTWVNITNYRAMTAQNGSVILPMWLLGTSTNPTTSSITANATWDASYNMIDARLGKAFHVSRHMRLNPHFGVRGGWIDQHFSTRYGASVSTSTVANQIHHGDNDFWGFGGRVGIDSDWILGKGWCLFANVSTSVLFGKFDVTQSIQPTTTDGMNISRHMYQNVPNFEMALGIGWNDRFFDNKYQISLKAAYEFIEWFDQLNMRRMFSGAVSSVSNYTNDVVSRGNFTMNGFSLRLQLDI